eukprot:250855_1
MDPSIELQKEQRQRIANLLTQNKYTDVTFVVGKDEQQKSFDVNRLFLASISPVFEAMLFGKMHESKPNATVIINDIDPDDFEAVLRYSYCADPQITSSNIVRVTIICDKYQISSLLIHCENVFKQCLNPRNICNMLHTTVSLKMDKYVQICSDWIRSSGNVVLDNGTATLQSNGFCRMNIEAMSIFLEHVSIDIKEEELWSYVLKWAQFQAKEYENNEAGKTKEVLECKEVETVVDNEDYKSFLLKSIRYRMRFGLMNGEYFVKNVVPERILTDKELVTIFCYQNCNNLRCGSFITTQRTDLLIVSRGDIDDSSASYNGSNTFGICLKTDTDLYLQGIGVFDCEGTANVKCEVFSCANASDSKLIGESATRHFIRDNKSGNVIPLMLKSAVRIKKNQKYKVSLWQKNDGKDKTYSISNRKTCVSVDGIEIKFVNGQHSAIPVLICSRNIECTKSKNK